MSRVSTARSRAEARDRIARQGEIIRAANEWLETTAGQVALVVALVAVVLATGWIGGL